MVPVWCVNSEASQDKVCAGSIDLTSPPVITDGFAKTGKKHSIELKTSARSYFLYSEEGQSDIDDWKVAIENLTADKSASVPAEVASKSRRRTFKVGGMMCPCCAENVEKALSRLKGVTATEIDLEKEIVTIDGKVERMSVIYQLEEAGFLPAEV